MYYSTLWSYCNVDIHTIKRYTGNSSTNSIEKYRRQSVHSDIVVSGILNHKVAEEKLAVKKDVSKPNDSHISNIQQLYY